MSDLNIHTLVAKLLKFSIVGAMMTVTTLCISVYLLKYVKTPLISTYVSVYGLSILVSYMLNSQFTFKSKINKDRAIIYFMIYLSAMGIGVLLLSIYQRTFDFENWVFPFMVIPFTMTYNFLLSNKYLKSDAQ